ncbi:MAG: sugar ABC transporter permease [Bacillota bacterium]|jgi:multiple sugar transport system permease protein
MAIKQLFDRYEKTEVSAAYLFILPVLITVFVFILVPVIGTFWESLFRDVSFLPPKFLGWANYRQIFTKLEFWAALNFTLLFTGTAVFLELVFGLLFALVLNETFPGRGIFRAALLIPWAVPTVVSAKMWKLMFDYTYGIINNLLLGAGMADGRINWLGNSVSAFGALVIADVWKTTPFVAIILLAGLQAIPGELYQQAQVDGTGMAKVWRRITLPLLKPIITVALIFRTIDSLRIFDLIYVLTGGGPGGATRSLSFLGYQYFSNDRFGMGSTIAVIMFLIAFTITVIYIKFGKFQNILR